MRNRLRLETWFAAWNIYHCCSPLLSIMMGGERWSQWSASLSLGWSHSAKYLHLLWYEWISPVLLTSKVTTFLLPFHHETKKRIAIEIRDCKSGKSCYLTHISQPKVWIRLYNRNLRVLETIFATHFSVFKCAWTCATWRCFSPSSACSCKFLNGAGYLFSESLHDEMPE